MKDNFDTLGWNFYLPVELSLRGLMLMGQFYDEITGDPKNNDDLTLPYPKLSDFLCYTNPQEFDKGQKSRKKKKLNIVGVAI
jgi:hypothetical protein